MITYEEAELIGGPSCGSFVAIQAGQAQYTEIIGGTYYRWDRIQYPCGRIVMVHTRTVQMGSMAKYWRRPA
ncbi:hypothetical protein [Planctomycetes bacterium TBK1r]|uniref:Uncharacterized protein n=1 Tax=Stieleria magnilauensis TaxID=2527963 RepID=A0ABX5Y1B2_9BACT|nr:hypothetical protein TBK1r_59920 [Planctomycetes bacterium TBK1r]QDV87043.1 hypothetical protein TBK1r_60700 [Planctomycetes bacterium TBK1r]